uniref:Uncharacterized protein n=1 Tax=Physcomitrium patens TaxID=3218 RepID=A0A2K1KH60_PHYPA|nr:hypothetical protein PHYPA_009480 [Physcomitrium patens]
MTLNCKSLSVGVNNDSCFVDKRWMCPEC